MSVTDSQLRFSHDSKVDPKIIQWVIRQGLFLAKSKKLRSINHNLSLI